MQISFISGNREAYHPTSRKAAYYQLKIHKILTFHCTNRKILVSFPFLWTEGGVNLVDRELQRVIASYFLGGGAWNP